MAVSDILNRRVKALPDETEEYSDISGSDDPENASHSESGPGDSDEDDEDVSEVGSEEAVSFLGCVATYWSHVLEKCH